MPPADPGRPVANCIRPLPADEAAGVRTFHLHRELWLPLPPERLFPFFAAPENLQRITPPFLDFRIVGCSDAAVHAGTIIDYRLKLHGIPLRWRSRIDDWNPPHGFTDVQLRGPYRRWVHRHTFVEKDGGTLAMDDVEYAVLGGAVVERLFVRRDVGRIFDYRNERLVGMFGSAPTATRATSGAPA